MKIKEKKLENVFNGWKIWLELFWRECFLGIIWKLTIKTTHEKLRKKCSSEMPVYRKVRKKRTKLDLRMLFMEERDAKFCITKQADNISIRQVDFGIPKEFNRLNARHFSIKSFLFHPKMMKSNGKNCRTSTLVP